MLRKLLVLLLIVFTGAAISQAKSKKPGLPEQFEKAKTVFVESRYGDLTDLRLNRDQRDAILDMQDGIQDWGRYSLASARVDADLIVVVYRGQYINGRSFPGNSPSTGPVPGRTPIQNPADASQSSATNPADTEREKDELRVYTLGQDGKLKGPIWRSQMDNGLLAPSLFLLQQLKYDVEKAYPSPAGGKPNTP
ncbi:hypothetical protein ACFPT7_12475 [Acidicapsa dinghuensis]|uniref:Uncharacterized protein n=1 Tax=Acidicapsa dinghuensis TaxID=2218256 RepID=A0ABW1EJG2_9BACT|nr:hypothetical protein [Acidicapsa dinghuensis]